LWAEWLDLQFGPLRTALEVADLHSLRSLLENMHREHLSIGVGGTIDDVKSLPGPVARAYYRSLWAEYRKLLETVRPDWGDIASPMVGNPHGAWVSGRLVQIETLRHAHHAAMLLKLLDGTPNARILEMGAGMGGQAYQFVSLGGHRLSRYTILDLPEVACLAGYCLMATLGEDRVRLFCEEEPCGAGPVVEVLPHWRITQCGPSSADLVLNTHSFSEMDGRSATFYLHEIERVSKRFFYHINHETRFRFRTPDGAESVNRIGSEMVPANDLFKLVSRCPQDFTRPENRAVRGFAYLYERQESYGSQRARSCHLPGREEETGRS
jgi:putative sugar O-methyltransferase